MSQQIPATSYSTIFHCDQGGFICFLRLLEGLVSAGMCWLFVHGYLVIKRQRNNKLQNEQRTLYNLAMFQTFFLALYYLVFQEFFMLASIRNFLIWISINILQIFFILNWQGTKYITYVTYGMNTLQIINFLLWFFISLGDGSSLANTDFQLGYNCMIPDWIIMSGILLAINFMTAILAYFKIDKLDFQLNQFMKDETNNLRKIKSVTQQKNSIIIIVCSGLIGALIMFGWDFLAFNNSVNRTSCEDIFSGNTIFRNILCFLLKIITMQLNPSAIYFIYYYQKRDQFKSANQEALIHNMIGQDYFFDGASDLNLTNSSRRSDSRAYLVSGRENVSQYH